MAIKIGRITLGVCGTNFYIVYQEDSKKCVVVDPADKGDYLYEKVSGAGFTIEGILLTHGHFDHIMGIDDLKKHCDAKVYTYEGEKNVCENSKLNASAMVSKPCSIVADEYLKDGAVIHLADMDIKLIATPGHTEGSCCFYIEEAGFLISGDTLFQESVGRTDLATGSMSSLVRSIREKLMVLPPETKVYPGHGESTTIEYEKQYNPFI